MKNLMDYFGDEQCQYCDAVMREKVSIACPFHTIYGASGILEAFIKDTVTDERMQHKLLNNLWTLRSILVSNVTQERKESEIK